MKLIFLLFSILLLSAVVVQAQPVSQTFNSSGTYVVPANYGAVVTIQTWGAGGGGGARAAETGGGGGGAYASISTTLGPGSYTVTVGGGGAVGSAGGNSFFLNLSSVKIVEAGGGQPGSATTNGAGAGGTVIIGSGFSGGTGGTGGNSNSAGGGGGGSATTSAPGGVGGLGVNGNNAAGGIAGIGTGNGGVGAINTNGQTATAGAQPGGGGGGRASNTSTSAAGGAGRVIVTVTAILPVVFGNIKAVEKQQAVEINFITYTEDNVSHYVIERSANGRTFSSIGEVKAFNSNLENNYRFLDNNAVIGLNYYRIRSIDFDGKMILSSIIRINLNKNGNNFVLYPNPAKVNNPISFQADQLSAGNYEMQMISAAGQYVYIQKLKHSGGAVTQTLALPTNLKTGVYTFRLTGNNSIIVSKTFVVL